MITLLLALGLLAEPPGPQLGFTTAGAWRQRGEPARLFRLDAVAPQLFDYTFASAPCDWTPTGGLWQVSNRYACDPSWSFFGGHSRGLACLWNKRRFAGDLLFEVYAAFTYGLPYTETVWLERPSDLCLTICGDGQSPASGYSFIFGSEDGRVTLLKRREVTLASTEEPRFLPPSFSDGRPDREAMHWRWWRLEARRQGGRLEFWIDGMKALEADDPEPLEGGQVALWTVHNGLVVSRARIAAAEVEPPALPLVRVNDPAPLPVTVHAAAPDGG